MIKVALVGSGYIAGSHIEAFKDESVSSIGKIVAVVGHKESGTRAAEKAGCRWFETLEEAEKETGFDAVDICTPTYLHEEYVVKAAEMEKHVLCEKPIALTLESMDRMTETCRKHNVRFMVAQVLRYMSDYAKIADAVRTGKLGKIHMYSSKRLSQHPSWATWHRDPSKSGGGLFDINVHDIDLVYSIFGMPDSVYCAGWKSPSGCFNHVVTSMKWPDKQAVCEASLEMTGAFPFTAQITATGDKGTIDFMMKAGDNIRDAKAVKTNRIYLEGKDGADFEAEENNGFVEEIKEFLFAIEKDEEISIAPSEVRDVLRIILAAQESLETGEVIHISTM